LFVPEFDQTLARLIEQSKFHENPGPAAKVPFSLAIMLFRQCMVEQRFPIVQVLPETVEILTRISRNKGGEELAKLLEEVKKFNPKPKEGVPASPSKRPTLSGSTPSLAQVLQQQGKSVPDVTSSAAFPPLGTNGVQQPIQSQNNATLDKTISGPQQQQPPQPQQPQQQPQSLSATSAANKQPVTPTQSFGQSLGASTDSSFAIPEGPGVREDVIRQFDEWLALFSQPNQNDKSFATYVLSAPLQNLLKEGETANKFFRVSAELMIERFFSSGGANATVANANNAIYFGSVDALAKLIVLFVKHCEPAQNKIPLLARILHVVVRVLMRDYEIRKLDFNQRPWFRFFVNCLIDINAPDPALDAIHLQVLLAFSNALLLLSPSRLPGFAFAWLELISNRNFMPKLLTSKSQKGWPWFQRLLVELFKFLEPYLRNAYLTEPIRVLYKGTLRVLLVLLHDFPEFLCDYHVSFCDIIPHSCIQMRNLILSAFPRSLRLPDPFTPNLKVDMLPEIAQPPRILSDFTVALQQGNFRAELEQYMKGQPGNLVNEPIKDKLLLSDEEAAIYGTRYNVARINALVLFVGAQAIMTKANAQLMLNHNGPDFAIFSHLSQELDSEGRYLFFNALANQLRYPNSHTHYFGIVLLHLFEKAPADIIKEQITRVLLERLIVNRPHPWGLLITFIELIKNPRYNFWSHQVSLFFWEKNKRKNLLFIFIIFYLLYFIYYF